MSAIQAITIREHEERSEPKPHIVYKISIQARARSWIMWRRYSEFADLHTELTKSTGSEPPAQLPPKHSFAILRSRHDAKLLEERQVGLESYLRAIVGAKDEKWRETIAFRDFLGVPVERQGGNPRTEFSSTSWLDEHIDLQSRIRDVRALINKRDALSDRGDLSESHKSNVDAKKLLANILTRIGNLGGGLEDSHRSGLTEGEIQRRTDMVAKLQDDCEKLGKMVTVARMPSRMAGGSVTKNQAPERDREALLGSSTSKPIRRVFGTPTPSKPQETDETRPLDDAGVLSLQNVQIEQQDQQLSQLSSILLRQRHLGEAIGAELALHNELLDDLSENVDRVNAKLSTAKRQLNRLG
jgi:regulator of vacuolar morphogenesis